MMPLVFRSALFIIAGIFSVIFAEQEEIIIDTFSAECKDHLPRDWQKFRDTKGITLKQDSLNYYVRIQSVKDVESIAKKVEFNIHDFPILRWRWRAHTLPEDGQENIKKKNDSAAGVYVAFKGMYPFNKVLKYVWSTALPVGTITKSPHSGSTMIFVIASGPEHLDSWIPEERNLLEDYLKAFGSQPPLAEAIAIQSDSDNTGSSACADFDDFYLSKYRKN